MSALYYTSWHLYVFCSLGARKKHQKPKGFVSCTDWELPPVERWQDRLILAVVLGLGAGASLGSLLLMAGLGLTRVLIIGPGPKHVFLCCLVGFLVGSDSDALNIFESTVDVLLKSFHTLFEGLRVKSFKIEARLEQPWRTMKTAQLSPLLRPLFRRVYQAMASAWFSACWRTRCSTFYGSNSDFTMLRMFDIRKWRVF